jgi:uncharacterized protein (DUF1800 family)
MRRSFRILSAAVLALCSLLATGASAQVAGQITVYPTTSSLEVTSTLQYTAYVPISPNTITWMVNNIPGGDATVGTISPTGLYKPPAVIPAANVLTVSAKSTAFPAQVGAASLTVTRPYPWLWSVSPTSFAVGTYKVTFNGANFAPDSQVLANGVVVPSTYQSSTSIVVNGSAAQAGTIVFAVRQPGPGAVTGNSVNATVKTAIVTVSVQPQASTVTLTKSQAFTATVGGTANTAVTWSVNNIAGGDAIVGTISAGGVYTAPAAMPATTTVTVRAASVASPGTSGQATVTLLAPMTVTVTPPSATVALGTTQAFASTVAGNANTNVTWSVNGTNGGSATVGTISAAGLYTAPAVMPASNTVTIRATSAVTASAFGQATVTLVPPVKVTLTPNAVLVRLGDTQAFTPVVTGNADTSVTWTVNSIAGGSATLGTITAAGVYTPPAVMPASNAITIRATSVAAPSAFAQSAVTLAAKLPATAWLTGARFLEQSSFGPTPATLAHVQQIGIDAYLDEQFAMPETDIPAPADNGMGSMRQWALYNYSTAPDQLRQRVAYALSQIIVTSANKLIYADEIRPWMRTLSANAFGNYRTLLREVTTSPSMGKYLDLARSMKPTAVSGANENYPRELMQLFSIGLWKLNQDGSYVKDAGDNQVPTYDQNTVRQVALALTGWVYTGTAYEDFSGPMVPRPANHDFSAKAFLGCDLPAGQSVDQDLDGVLDCLMQHPNIAPFIATRLIRALVTSNPTPAYITRVANVFAGVNGGTPGDLKATVKAILLDPEARDDAGTPSSGRLKDAIQQTVGLVRLFNGQFGINNQITYLYDYMSQPILTPASVFSWYSPLYHIPKNPLFGPEFQIYSATDATERGNFFYSLLGAGVTIPAFAQYGNDMPGLVEAANQAFLYGRMPAAMKQAIVTAATPGYDAATRIQTVLYLTSLTGQYAVQY